MTPTNEARPAETGDWVLVPRAPTEAMLSAYDNAFDSDAEDVGGWKETARREWSAMIDAAPDKPVDLGADAERGALVERLEGPVQWGYMCLADGGFIADDTPLEAAAALCWTPPASVDATIEREAIARTVFSVLHPHESWDSFNERYAARGGHCHPWQDQSFEVADAVAALSATPTHPDQEGGA